MQLAQSLGSGRGGLRRRALAVAAARAVARACRLVGRDGTALPGLVALRIDDTLLGSLAGQLRDVVVVVGANGKTTSTRLTARILERATGVRPVSNRSGANLVQGIVTSIIADAQPVDGRVAVLEVDELTLSRVAREMRPAVVVMMNLLRDQLDRYGEIDAVVDRWSRDLETLPTTTRLVVCADDPRVEKIARAARQPVLRFGLAGTDRDRPSAGADPDRASTLDRAPCPDCGERVDVVGGSATGLGPWTCVSCGTGRSPLDLEVRIDRVDPDGWMVLRFDGPASRRPGSPRLPDVHVQLSGPAGAYDCAAAVLAAIALGIEAPHASMALDGATPAFGRLEEVLAADRRIVLTLAKNPASVAEAVNAVTVRKPDGLLLGLGDRHADGRDISWIWDAPLDRLPDLAPTTLTGDRADDLALRIRYGLDDARDPDDTGLRLVVDHDVEHALDAALAAVPPGGTLMVLGTYTTLLAIRKILERRGLAPALPR